MPQKSMLINNMKIAQDSIFDMGELYKNMFRWFETYEYDFHEDGYEESNTQAGKQVKFYWTAEKKMDAYIKYVIELNVFILGLQSIEIEKEGLKTKTHKGNIEFRITGYLLKDYDGKWSKTPFHTTLRYLYDKIIARKRYNIHEREFMTESKKLLDEIRAFLNLNKL